MTDEKYIANQKNYIRRELREIIKTHINVSVVPVIIIAVILFIMLSCQSPASWSRTTFTLSDFYTMQHRRGAALELVADDGRSFTVKSFAQSAAAVLEKGGQYTITCADNLFRKVVTEMTISGQEYVSLDKSIEAYRNNNILYGVFIALITLLLIAGNVFAGISMKQNFNRIRKYQRRIKTRSGRAE